MGERSSLSKPKHPLFTLNPCWIGPLTTIPSDVSHVCFDALVFDRLQFSYYEAWCQSRRRLTLAEMASVNRVSQFFNFGCRLFLLPITVTANLLAVVL